MNTKLTMHDVMIEAIAQSGDLEEAKQAGAAVSNHLLVMAQTFDAVGTSPTGKKEYKGEPTGFLGACFEQEQWAKSADAGIHMVEAIPRCWTQAKTNIKAAMVMGLDLNQFDTESSMRKELNEAREAMKGAGEDVPEVASTEIQPILDAIANIFDGLDADAQELLKDDLVNLHTEYVKMLDKVLPDAPVAPAEGGNAQQPADSEAA